MQCSGHPGASFVEVNDIFFLCQVRFHLFIDRHDLLLDLLASRDHCGFSHRVAIQIAKDLAHPFQWNELVLVEVCSLGFDPRTILHRLRYFDREFGFGHFLALGTLLDLSPMFRHFHTHRCQIKHLSLHVRFRPHLFQRGLAVPTAPHSMRSNIIRVGDRFQGMPFVTG